MENSTTQYCNTMRINKIIFTIGLLVVLTSGFAADLSSVYTMRPDDPEAFYFTTEKYGVTADGKNDVSEALQEAINQVKRERNFGILFIPEGKYVISRTIYIPNAIRLIGYGKKRPEFILKANSPGFQEEVTDDKGKARYMFWFTGGMVQEGQPPRDAGAGTFYSAMTNIDLRIEKGNPHAVALRTHYAQHSFISNMVIHIGQGKAGLFDVGNEMENVAFFGGDYGIYTTKASPGWPVMMADSYFEGQRKAALRVQESGLAMVNLQARNVPVVFEIEPNYGDRLLVENGRFENITEAALVITNENNSNTQITLRNVECAGVPLLARYTRSGTETRVSHKSFLIRSYDHGLQMESMTGVPRFNTALDAVPLEPLSPPVAREIPALPPMEEWVNIRTLGAKGDDLTDDTRVFREALEKYDCIYVPQGWYLISEPLKMKPNTRLIGLHPFGTQLRLAESTPAFSGFGAPQPLLESAEGGSAILNGIGLNTGGFNYRAVGLKWMAGAGSYVNDVKFVGGHGGLAKPDPQGTPPQLRGNRPQTSRISSPSNPVATQGMDLAWDNQYWSMWVTNNGGGTFKDIWTASTYASSGLYVSHTTTPGKIYAMSLEHHVRNEARFTHVANWKIYAFQLEEESRESTDCQPVELDNCRNITFGNLYMFRVIRVNEPYHNAVRVWNCEDIHFLNLHNFAQTKYTTDLPVYDINRDIEVRPWELQKLVITGKEPFRRSGGANRESALPWQGAASEVKQLARGFEFVEGLTSDSKGNVYFCEHRMRRIYKWSADSGTLSLVADFPWKPSALAIDSEDHLLVLFRYDPQPGFLVNGEQESAPLLPDRTGTSYSGWGNSGFSMLVYSLDPNDPDHTIKPLPLVSRDEVQVVHKALYPANRWRDFHDFNTVTVSVPEKCFLAPDGKTIIPQQYDLARCSALLEAFPGKPFYLSDEYDRRMVRYSVAPDGTLHDLSYFVEWGEFGSTTDDRGNLYVADGNILIFDEKGNSKGRIEVPERPSTLVFGGKEKDILFITGRNGLYGVKVSRP